MDDPNLIEPHNLGTNVFRTWGYFDDASDIELSTDGAIDDSAIQAFTHGHCHSFALAVCGLLPGAIPTINWNSGAHCAAMLPDGRLIDVEGYVPTEDARWTADGFTEPVDNWDDEHWIRDGWKNPRPMDALPYAETLLRELDFPI